MANLDVLCIELQHMIVGFLDSDQAICNYRSICRSTQAAVDERGCYVWSDAFARNFDREPGLRGEKLKQMYQTRRKRLRKGANFRMGYGNREQQILYILRDLICNSNSAATKDGEDSPNYRTLARFVVNHDILRQFCKHQTHFFETTNRFRGHNVATSKPQALLLAVQITLSAFTFSLAPEMSFKTWSFGESQRRAYGDIQRDQVVQGNVVNLSWVAHVINFFKNHMCNPTDQTMFDAYSELPTEEQPSGWTEKLKNGAGNLGTYWKGTYAYLERNEMADIRSSSVLDDQDEIYTDKNIDGGARAIQTLTLEFPEKKSDFTFPWPRQFEQILKSITPPPSTGFPRTRAQHQRFDGPNSSPTQLHTPPATPSSRPYIDPRNPRAASRTPSPHASRRNSPTSPTTPGANSNSAIDTFINSNVRFQGKGWDEENFYSTGWLNALPSQQGIPGWQRMTMMKYFIMEDGTFDNEALWAYEGVVLPGGKIIVGRWWAPSEVDMAPLYSGPFILWNVDKSEPADQPEFNMH
ncbi:hypothetical protein K402DRAFT_452164 [Aulographum hederae CBS 113979]|uniref:F-box domain-containing protein n=1 Tax=Aulographum hederae CBS 113979 TaxID=1176131 RepID=A0A6G1H885_9PEZI|nr:hypothetical protein K402DRAFT_452164 [Aulographum hederae CBS 113979]